jgi:hypothetical protein
VSGKSVGLLPSHGSYGNSESPNLYINRLLFTPIAKKFSPPQHNNCMNSSDARRRNLPNTHGIQANIHTKGDCDFAILPRRKAGQPIPPSERGPVIVTKSLLENYFGRPLIDAATELVMMDPLRYFRIGGLG